MVTFLAHFDGKHLLPAQPVDLPTDKPLRVSVEEVPARADVPPLNLGAWLESIVAETGLVEGPDDWAAQHDHYLYGATKQEHTVGG